MDPLWQPGCRDKPIERNREKTMIPATFALPEAHLRERIDYASQDRVSVF